MYSPFLWRIAKGQSLIIKRRWPSKACQIYLQELKLGKHVHQKLTMSRLNGHDSLQHTTNVRIIQSRRWRCSNSSQIHIRLSRRITCRRERRRCDTKKWLNPRAFRACSHLSSSLPKKGGTYRSYNMNRSDAGNSSKPKCNKIWWIKTGQTMSNRTTLINLNQRMNKKIRKTHRSVCDKSIQKCTFL